MPTTIKRSSIEKVRIGSDAGLPTDHKWFVEVERNGDHATSVTPYRVEGFPVTGSTLRNFANGILAMLDGT